MQINYSTIFGQQKKLFSGAFVQDKGKPTGAIADGQDMSDQSQKSIFNPKPSKVLMFMGLLLPAGQ